MGVAMSKFMVSRITPLNELDALFESIKSLKELHSRVGEHLKKQFEAERRI
jgi:hypothetical protein